MRWVTATAEQLFEESPDITGQCAAENTQARQTKACRDRQCHRKQTALRLRGARVKRRCKRPPPSG